MLKKLNKMFRGRWVEITTINPTLPTTRGICEIIMMVPNSKQNNYNLVLIDGRRYGFKADKLNSKSVEQKDFRMIVLIEEKHEEAFEQSHSYSLCYPKKVFSPTTTTNILFDSPADIDRYFHQLKNMDFISYYKVRPSEYSNELIASYVLTHEEKKRRSINIQSSKIPEVSELNKVTTQ